MSACYDTAGTLLWQRRGRVMHTGEQDLKSWRGGWVFVATVPGPLLGGIQMTRPFLQKITAAGDTLPGVTYSASANWAFPTCVLPDARGFSILGLTLQHYVGGPLSPSRYQFMRTDTAGTLLWTRFYGSPLWYGNAYGTDAVRRPDGGYLLIGSAQCASGFHPLLILTDSLGREHRRRMLIIRDSAWIEVYDRFFGHTLELPNGGGYVLNCRVQVPVPGPLATPGEA
ncbi:hypothetical protein GCM10027048_34260 [Hymenobacter coalescens]